MEEDLRSTSQSMHDDANKSTFKPALAVKKKNKLFLPLIIFVSISVLAVGIFAVWKFLLNKPKPVQTPVVSKIDSTPKKSIDVPDADLNETYASTALSVQFKYPKTWKVTEATGGIRIESPSFSYRNVLNTEVTGIFRIYIRQGARAVDGPYIGKGVAIKPSEKLVYTQPAVGQRTETLLSSFGDMTKDNFSFFMIAGNFQLNAGDTLGPNYGREPDTYIVVGGYSTPEAIDDLATTPVTLDYYATTNAYKQALAIIASLQLQ